ncbi:YjgP/YjgQ family permease [candidate division NPL-UPA2 bacterium Unc8]|uniref:YjgP/YjgQ family permease n=1 Tax=candidate division NPL-UPA2 bacterium Unc8 TaxID=1980939 RepID=A0A399G0Q4_UNCN2|nr:MAG: YjgP/YjgQ family permease [candidate division NPL-UPA2 bacterium Unc8]
MKVLSFYVVREFLFALPPSFLIFNFIFFVGRLPQLINVVIDGGGGVLFRLLTHIFTLSLPYSLPIAVLAAILAVTGRLSDNNEFLAVRASGIRVWHLFTLVFLVSFFASLFLLYFGNNVSPLAKYRLETTIHRLAEKGPYVLFEERVFVKEFTGYRFFVEQVKGEELRGVHIWQLRGEKFPVTISARRGRVVSDASGERIILLLFDGVKEEVVAADLRDYRRSRFKEYHLSVLLPQTIERGRRLREMTLQELRDEVGVLKGRKVYALLTEINRRAALAFTPLIFVVIGVPLGIIVKKEGRSVGFGLSVLVVIIYYIMMMFFGALSEGGMLPPAIAMWLPGGVLAAAGTFLIKGS